MAVANVSLFDAMKVMTIFGEIAMFVIATFTG
jgi:hypothetical protein